MKIRLLENPGYAGMDIIEFPVEVEADVSGRRAYVPRPELHRIGVTHGFNALAAYCFPQGCWEKAE